MPCYFETSKTNDVTTVLSRPSKEVSLLAPWLLLHPVIVTRLALHEECVRA